MTTGIPIPKPPSRKKQKAKKDREDKRRLIELHNIVCERARVVCGDLTRYYAYRCFHCRNLFPRDMVCADHFPITKARNPAIRYDPDACVCSCGPCNTSGNKDRAASFKRLAT